jgi:hypothetical protein
MNREELEQKIAEASDGVLTAAEIAELEFELKKWPELQQDYQAIMSLPNFEKVFPLKATKEHSEQIDNILGIIKSKYHKNEQFTELSLYIFKKYALAASILILAGSSALLISNESAVNTQGSSSSDELFTYEAESSASDNYMIQIDNLLLDENSDEY